MMPDCSKHRHRKCAIHVVKMAENGSHPLISMTVFHRTRARRWNIEPYGGKSTPGNPNSTSKRNTAKCVCFSPFQSPTLEYRTRWGNRPRGTRIRQQNELLQKVNVLYGFKMRCWNIEPYGGKSTLEIPTTKSSQFPY